MRVALCTIGSTGDVQPFLALAQELLARRHPITACTNSFYRERFEALGTEFRAIGPDATWERVRAPLQRIIATQNPMTQFSILAQEMFENPTAAYEGYRAALKGADVAVIHFLDPMAMVAATDAGIPWAQVRFESGGIPTRHQLALHMGSLGKSLNSLSWRLGDIYWRRQEQRVFGSWMRTHRTSPRPVLMRGHSPYLNLLAASRALAPVYPDFPRNLVQTGAWFLEEPAFRPPEKLLAFLEEHPRPLLVTFGSMGAEDGQAVAELVREAASSARVPLILQKGFSRFAIEDAQDFMVVEYLPHGWIFPRVAAVVHHGGAGTSTATARAGVPSVVVPHLLDQFGWARLLHRKGLAPKPLPRQRLTASRLAGAIREVIANTCYRDAARSAAAVIAAEPGVRLAADLVEEVARKQADKMANQGSVCPPG